MNCSQRFILYNIKLFKLQKCIGPPAVSQIKGTIIFDMQ